MSLSSFSGLVWLFWASLDLDFRFIELYWILGLSLYKQQNASDETLELELVVFRGILAWILVLGSSSCLAKSGLAYLDWLSSKPVLLFWVGTWHQPLTNPGFCLGLLDQPFFWDLVEGASGLHLTNSLKTWSLIFGIGNDKPLEKGLEL
ncbi:hypothetical protein F8M41_023903 [Gigaspora margarita]|uniref:Uncharacterized protein n=1 Tax=Gigaspora margarita TaxID=4874 RepID=A0A8H4EGW3_GIGMA|nr:hypothetical protein F8M41_023903 [Gigaspora margarita]